MSTYNKQQTEAYLIFCLVGKLYGIDVVGHDSCWPTHKAQTNNMKSTS